MIVLLLLWLTSSCQANGCFEKCEIDYGGSFDPLGKIGNENTDNYMDRLLITNYHCVMKCANMLSQATMELGFGALHEKFNHGCILIESLDYCVQYWKQINDVDCDEPIKNMVKRNFKVSTSTQRGSRPQPFYVHFFLGNTTQVIILGYIGYV